LTAKEMPVLSKIKMSDLAAEENAASIQGAAALAIA